MLTENEVVYNGVRCRDLGEPPPLSCLSIYCCPLFERKGNSFRWRITDCRDIKNIQKNALIRKCTMYTDLEFRPNFHSYHQIQRLPEQIIELSSGRFFTRM